MRASGISAPTRTNCTGINGRDNFLLSFWTVKFVDAKHLLATQDSNHVDGLFVDSVKHPARRDYQMTVGEIWNLRRNGPHLGE